MGRNHILRAVLLASVCGLIASPAISAPGGAGSTTANFLKIGMGARAEGMGEAFAPVADDSSAVFWNPAGLVLTRGTQMSMTHAEWLQGVRHEFLTFSSRQGDEGALGASLTYLGIQPYRGTRENAAGEFAGPGDIVNAHELALSLAYSQRLGFWNPGRIANKVLLGVKVTLLNQDLAGQSGTAGTFDFGGMYEIKRRRTYASITLSNVGTSLQGSGQPFAFGLGFSHNLRKLLMKRDRLTLALAAPLYMDTGFRGNVGFEYGLRFGDQEAALRGGYKSGYELNGTAGVCVGAGILKHYTTFDIGLDYALAPYGELGLTHRITLSIMTGGPPVGPQPFLDAPEEFTAGVGTLPIRPKYSTEEGVASWRITVSDLKNRPVTTFQGTGEPPSKLIWDGKLAGGKLAPEADYRVDFKMEDTEDQVGWAAPKVVKLKRIHITPMTEYQYSFRFAGDLLFDSGRSELKPKGYEAIAQAAMAIRQRYPESDILVAGHTDNVKVIPTSQYKNNEGLSLARAEAVKDYLVKSGFDAAKLKVVGYGETRPLAPNTTAENRAKNRRVELVVSGEKTLTPDGLMQEAAGLMQSGQYDGALVQLKKAADLDPENAKVYKLMGNCLYRMGRKDEAMASFRQAMELDPSDASLAGWMSRQGGEPPAPTPTP